MNRRNALKTTVFGFFGALFGRAVAAKPAPAPFPPEVVTAITKNKTALDEYYQTVNVGERVKHWAREIRKFQASVPADVFKAGPAWMEKTHVPDIEDLMLLLRAAQPCVRQLMQELMTPVDGCCVATEPLADELMHRMVRRRDVTMEKIVTCKFQMDVTDPLSFNPRNVAALFANSAKDLSAEIKYKLELNKEGWATRSPVQVCVDRRAYQLEFYVWTLLYRGFLGRFEVREDPVVIIGKSNAPTT